MSIKISYFDFPGGRGEDCRLALHIAGVEFQDDRFPGKEWSDRKAHSPFGSAPILSVEGKGQLGQSNAILSYIGREFGLHPSDPWEAAQHDAVMMSVEEMRERLAQDTDSSSEEAKQASREAFADGRLKEWSERMEARIAGPFLAGEKLQVADLKLAGFLGFYKRGGVDHIPADYFEAYPKLNGLHEAFLADARVQAWYAR